VKEMASKVKILSEEVISKIAAGEVIDRPASVVKELVENSIDAGSSEIEVRVENGGKDLIQVIDNGEGMSREDVKLALERHATSKIDEANDIFSIRSLGFRGEALPSIAAVSRMKIKTRTEDNLGGTLIKISGSEIKDIKDVGCPVGTNIIIKDLFYNTPVRYKYLKTTSTEMSKISDIINRLALAYPEISFKLSHNQRKSLESPGNAKLRDCILSVYGKEVAKNIIKVDYEDKYMKVKGYVSKPNINRSSRKHQSFFINRRYIKSKTLSEAISEAYHTLLPKNRNPIVVLMIKLNPILVDVNVHPTKLEVNFSREREVFEVVRDGVKEALRGSDLTPEANLSSRKKTTTRKKKKNFKNETESKQQEKLNLTENINNIPKSKLKESKPKRNKDKEKINHKEVNKEKRNEIDNKEINEVDKKKNIEVKEAALGYESTYESNQSEKPLTTLFPMGQVHNTYIIARGEDGFYIIDQHAAHERIIYERLLKKFKNTEVNSQPLLIPLKLELTQPEIEIIEENRESMENLGFEIEHFGGQTYFTT
jgi:DNA mismatch repair protein MutL